MWKLNWLMFRSFIGPFALSFFLLVFILDMQFFWLYLDDLLGKGLEWYVIAELLFYASANVVPMALPLSVLLSSTMTYGNLAENLELTALKASGYSFLRISRPLILVMFLIGGFAFYFSNTLWPTANFKMKALLTDIYKAKSTLMISEGRFSNEIDNFGIRATTKDKQTGELGDILIFDRSGNIDEHNIQRYNYREDMRDYHRDIRAESGVIVNSKGEALSLILRNGQITEELNPERFEDMKYPFWKIDFETSRLNVDLSSMQFDRTEEDAWAQSLEWMSATQLLDMKDSILSDLPETYSSMGRFIKAQNNLQRDTSYIAPVEQDFFMNKLSDPERKRIIRNAKDRTDSQRKSVERKVSYIQGQFKDLDKIDIYFHQKFTLSIACIILFFVGAPLGAIVKKGGLGVPVLITIILFLIYYVLTRTGEQMAHNDVTSPFWGMWMSSFVLAPIGLFFTFKANQDSGIFDRDYYKKLFKRLKRQRNEDPTTV